MPEEVGHAPATCVIAHTAAFRTGGTGSTLLRWFNHNRTLLGVSRRASSRVQYRWPQGTTWCGWIAENLASMTRASDEMTEGLAVCQICPGQPAGSSTTRGLRPVLSRLRDWRCRGASTATPGAILIEAVSRMSRSLLSW